MERLIDIGSDPVASLLDLLLAQGCQYRERGGLASHGEEFMAEWSKKYLDVILPILEEHYGGHDPDNLKKQTIFDLMMKWVEAKTEEGSCSWTPTIAIAAIYGSRHSRCRRFSRMQRD
ncbi:hypothetical protein DW045_06185 [Bifidobacterium pseudocatenulatum]|nr:hypothetical protein DW045_06185 [Bifidobacterium pseudocatenulatum]